jgi:hypothetical protein
MRAALAPWMMNMLWATKKGKVQLEDLMVINMLDSEGNREPLAPQDAATDLQNRVHNTMQMLAGVGAGAREG